MPRIRTLKPSFWVSDDIGSLDFFARLLFIGLISQADDEGRLSAGPSKVRVLLFPWDDPAKTQPLVDEGLSALVERGMIIRYISGGKECIAIPTWEEHQKISKRTASKIPAPEDSGSTPVVLPEDSGSAPARKGMEGNGRGKEEESGQAAPAIPRKKVGRKTKGTSRKRRFTDRWDTEYLAAYGRPNPEWALSGAAEGRAADRVLSALEEESEPQFWEALAIARQGDNAWNREKATTIRGFATVYGSVSAGAGAARPAVETAEDRRRRDQKANERRRLEEERGAKAMEDRLSRMTPEQRAEHEQKIEQLKSKLASGGVSSLVNIKEI